MLRKYFTRCGIALSLVVGLLIVTRTLIADASKDEKTPQGTWTLLSGESDGQTLTEAQLKDGKLEINGDDYTFTIANKEPLKGTEQLDPTKDPMTIDITDASGPNKDKTCLGIYELKDDQFCVVLAQPGKPRPTEFTTTPDSGQWMHVWKRVK